MGMKKRQVLALVVGISLLLGGCGTGDNTEEPASGQDAAGSQETGTENTDEETQGENTEDETLTVWVWDPAFSIYTIEEAAKIFQEDHPGFKLNVVETSEQDVKTKIATMSAAGNLEDLPDIFCLQDTSFQNMVQNYTEVFHDLTDSPIDFSQFLDFKVEASVYDGKNYGIPFDTGTCVYAVRTDYLEAGGHTLEDITDVTWDEFIQVGKDVVEATGHPLLTQVSTEPQLPGIMMQSAGQSVFQEDGSVEIADNELLIQCIDIYNELVDTGVMQILNSNDELVTGLSQGTIGGTLSGCWILASVQLADDQSGKWAVTNIPSLPGVEGATNYSNLGGSSWAISSNCKNPELAEEFFAATFGGSIELYETVFPSTGLIAPYIPAAESGIYDTEQEFFGGQKVYQDIADYAQLVPTVPYGQYTAEFNTALGVALTNIASGADVRQELQIAQETVDFAMEGKGDA